MDGLNGLDFRDCEYKGRCSSDGDDVIYMVYTIWIGRQGSSGLITC